MAVPYYRRLADQHRQALKESGFDRVYPDLRQFCLAQQWIHGTASKRMIEAARAVSTGSPISTGANVTTADPATPGGAPTWPSSRTAKDG